MASNAKSRWADDEEDTALYAQRKREKEEKKKVKAEKQRRLEAAEEEDSSTGKQEALYAAAPSDETVVDGDSVDAEQERPSKRRRLSPEAEETPKRRSPTKLLRFPAQQWGPCRHVDNFEKLNHIEEGSYGYVSRAKETATGEIVALKKLKMDNANEGFPVTGLREIQTLMASRHPNIVALREVVMGDALQDVFIVLEFVEHDLKTLQEVMPEPFLPSEIKTLLLQLTSAITYLHSHWILHRDLKTSNLLLNNRGQLKVADFGMARYFGDPPPPNLTQLVVTLWYRAPELLLGAETYGPEVDMWSIGCIVGELLKNEPLLQGKNEVDQISKIFSLLGIPSSQTWPALRRLPNAKSLRLPTQPTTGHHQPPPLRTHFPFLTTAGSSLLTSLLSLNPAHRPSAADTLRHPYFAEDPQPKSALMFPTFPSRAGQEKRRRLASPNAPIRGDAPRLEGGLTGGIFGRREDVGGGWGGGG